MMSNMHGWQEAPLERSRVLRIALLGVALVTILGCSLDGRKLRVGTESLSPEAGSPVPGGGGLTVVPSYVDLGGVTQGFAARARLRLTNAGTAPLAAPVVGWASGSTGDFTLIQNQCSGELSPGEQCDLRVQVVPSTVGALQGTLELATGSTERLSLPVMASGLQPGPLVVQPAAGSYQDFGGVRVGVGSEATFTVSNPGAAPSGALSLAFNRPEFSLLPAAAGECVPGVSDLASGATCNFRVAFAPTERGPLEATLSLSSTGAGSRSITLRGQGLVPAALGLSASSLDFGGVVPGDAAILDLEVENAGDEPMILASAQLSPAGGLFRIADSNCGEGVMLPPAQRCRMQLEYRPTEAGQTAAAELIVAAQAGGPSAAIALQGVALTRGNLVVEALAAGEDDFGDVLLGASVARTFRISNPTQQASGALALTTRNGFVLEPLAESGACELGVTELGNAQSCTVRVTFTPSARGVKAGALTVNSPLAGAKSLALRGRGVLAGVIDADTGAPEDVVDFGRVTTGGNASRTLSVRNVGDQPLAPPAIELTGSSPDQAGAFNFQSSCSEALAAGAACEVAVQFAPLAVVAYAASLDLVDAAGQRSSVLLLGEALEPGRLVLAAAEGASPDFGDVAVGSSVTRSFSVTNPGGGTSGALSVLTDDSQFVVGAGACADAGADGLADSESCSFDVTFTPTTNTASEARLSVQAASSGETGIALTGRGRLAAILAATTTERDLGRANIGQPSGPTNQFTWTFNNGGDLTSGPASVTNSNDVDFEITEDTCSGVAVPGGGSCALTIVFAPDAAGDRITRITVDDVAAAQSVPLTVTGFGVQLAGPGEACVATGDCSAGVCTGGVCCDQECSLTCQSCATGQCLALTGQEPCGNSGGVCFGVEQCALPAGGGCTDDSQCGGGLVCKTCLSGARQCTSPDACCGGCVAGYDCIDGVCGCAPQADGRPRIDCGPGLCAQNRANACCPNTPPAGCNCDPSDNLCKECLNNGDCTDGLVGGTAVCNANRTCSYGCPVGTKECNGSCILNNQCCGNCGAGQSCNTAVGQCVINDGGSCTFGGPACASGNCSAGQCCDPGCGNGCFADGSCACPAGEEFARGDCRPSSGATCSTNADCAGTCVQFFIDADNDGFGDPTRSVRYCGSPPANVNPPVVANIDRPDCCDDDDRVKPGQSLYFGFIGANCPSTWLINDHNCDDRLESELPPTEFSQCEGPVNLPCEQRSGVWVGEGNFLGLTEASMATQAGLEGVCGNSSAQYQRCSSQFGVCEATFGLSPPCR